MASATVDYIIERVLAKIRGSIFTSDDVLQSLNECNSNIATILNIKELVTVAEVTLLAGDTEMELPGDFLKNLFFVYNKTDSCRVAVRDSRRLIDSNLADLTSGTGILAICVDFPNLYWQYKPSTDKVVDIHYCRSPDDLKEGGTFPKYIPASHIYKLFFNYACAHAFDFMEDGIAGEKVNTIYHESKHDIALAELRLFIGPDPDLPKQMEGSSSFNFSDC